MNNNNYGEQFYNKNDLYANKSGSMNIVKQKKINKILMIVGIVLSSIALVLVIVFLIVKFAPTSTPTAEEVSAREDSTEEYTYATDATQEETTSTQPVIEETVMLDIPNVIGMSLSDAYDVLDETQIKYQIAYIESQRYEPNFIVSQSPAPGYTVSSDEMVTIYVSESNDTNSTGSNHEIVESSSYMLPNSNKEYLEKDDIYYMSETELELALNEIYARRGRLFNTDWIAEYFNSKSWYNGYIAPEDFNEDVFNMYEKANVQLIVSVLEEKGYW